MSQGAIKFSTSQVVTPRLKHVSIRHAFIRDLVEQEVVKVVFCSSKQNKANGFTKVTLGEEFKNFLTHLNIYPIEEPK